MTSCAYCYAIPVLDEASLVYCANCDAALCEDCRSFSSVADEYFCLIPEKSGECHRRYEEHQTP